MMKKIQVEMLSYRFADMERLRNRLFLMLAVALSLCIALFINISFADVKGLSVNGAAEDKQVAIDQETGDLEAMPVENADGPDVLPPDTTSNQMNPRVLGIATDYALQIMKVPYAWEVHSGSSDVVIAVIDTGLHLTHPEFVGRIVPGYDFVNEDNVPMDDHGHGTHISGIIAASMDDGNGTTGVCPYCSIMPVKVLDEHNFGYWETITEGIIYAVDHGADIINLSLGSLTSARVLEDAMLYAEQNGVLIVAAAGNRDTDAEFYPAALPNTNIITVSATDKRDQKWVFSNYGDYVDVSAPGNFIYSTDIDPGNPNGGWGYSAMSGTSMAAPHVAGLAGLLLSQNGERTPEQLIQLIIESSDDLSTRGWDPIFGYGRVNAHAALRVEQPDNNIYFPLLMQ